MCEETQHGHPGVDRSFHRRLQELTPRERVERGDGLVEDQKLWPLRERERQRDLRLLSSRELSNLLPEREPQLLDPFLSRSIVPARVELPSQLEGLGDREAAVERMLLRHEPEVGKHR